MKMGTGSTGCCAFDLTRLLVLVVPVPIFITFFSPGQGGTQRGTSGGPPWSRLPQSHIRIATGGIQRIAEPFGGMRPFRVASSTMVGHRGEHWWRMAARMEPAALAIHARPKKPTGPTLQVHEKSGVDWPVAE
jgi:hypothetical protein